MQATCAPDYITQQPAYCHAWVRPPAKVGLPLAPDAPVSIATKHGALHYLGGYCRERWRGQQIVAVVERCAGGLKVRLYARDRRTATLVEATGVPA